MGKSNRIRNSRAVKVSSAPAVKQKKEMPGWVMSLIAIVITVAVLLSVVVSILSANGIFLRMSTPMKTDNYKVTGNMLSYYFMSNFQSFYSNYSTLIGTTSTSLSLDLSKDLKDQQFGASLYDSAYLGSFTGTWFDYFMNQTTTQVTEMLVYCEEADARGIALDEEEIAAIDAELTALQTYASLYGYPSVNSYLSASFGEGITKGDVRKCLEISSLATKCANAIVEEFDAALPFDSEEITTKYNENKKDFDVVDYSYFTFSTSYDDAVEAILGSDATDDEIADQKIAIETKYKELIAEVTAKAEALAAITNQKDFENYIITDYVVNQYAEKYKSATIKAETVPTAVVMEEIKQAIIAEVTDMAINGKEYEAHEHTEEEAGEGEEAATVEFYGHTVNADYADAMIHFREDLLDAVVSMTTSYFKTDVSFSETEFLKWAYGVDLAEGAEAPKALDVKTVESGEKAPETINDESSYAASVYMLVAAPAPNKNLTRDITFATFTTEADAKEFIEFLKGKGETVTAEDFKAYAEEKEANNVDVLEDYLAGGVGISAFDDQAFAESFAKGNYSTTVVTITADSSYAVIHYTDDGEEAWKVDVKDTLLNEKIEANYKTLLAKYTPVEKPNAIKKVNSYFG